MASYIVMKRAGMTETMLRVEAERKRRAMRQLLEDALASLKTLTRLCEDEVRDIDSVETQLDDARAVIDRLRVALGKGVADAVQQ